MKHGSKGGFELSQLKVQGTFLPKTQTLTPHPRIFASGQQKTPARTPIMPQPLCYTKITPRTVTKSFRHLKRIPSQSKTSP